MTNLVARGSEEQASTQARRAAFYDVDGTLVKTNIVHAYAYYAINHPSFRRKIGNVVEMFAKLPVYALLNKRSRKEFNEYFYRNYKGFTEDRLVVVGEEVFDKVMRPAIFPGVYDLVQRYKELGIQQVIVTGALEYVTAPLARHLGIEHWIANRLEIVEDMATGRLLSPVLAGPNKAQVIRQYAHKHDIDLERSFAFADSYSDFPMLSMVGNPCVVNPDSQLRRAAGDYNWPIITVQS